MTTGYPLADILLVEDDPRDVELTLRALRRNRLANPVKVLGDGVEALEYLFGEGAPADSPPRPLPRVVILDLKLPRVGGLEVLRRLKADPRTRSVPVVVLTSSHEEADVVRSYELGVNSYIVKPLDFERFVEAVSHLGLYWMVVNHPPGGTP
jgi:two-component system, response regulator